MQGWGGGSYVVIIKSLSTFDFSGKVTCHEHSDTFCLSHDTSYRVTLGFTSMIAVNKFF